MKVDISIVNETENYIFYEEVENWDYCENEKDVYHAAKKEYGKCISKVYINNSVGKAQHIGWSFQKKCKYDDTNDEYIQTAWICPIK